MYKQNTLAVAMGKTSIRLAGEAIYIYFALQHKFIILCKEGNQRGKVPVGL
jgi:hypothetical protein